VEIPHKKEFYALKEPDKAKLTEFYQKMNFLKFLHDLGLE